VEDRDQAGACHAHPHRRGQRGVAVSRGQAGGFLQFPIQGLADHQDQGAGMILHR